MAVRLDVAPVTLENTGQAVAEDTTHPRRSFLRRGFGFVRLPGRSRRDTFRVDDPFPVAVVCPHTTG